MDARTRWFMYRWVIKMGDELCTAPKPAFFISLIECAENLETKKSRIAHGLTASFQRREKIYDCSGNEFLTEWEFMNSLDIALTVLTEQKGRVRNKIFAFMDNDY